MYTHIIFLLPSIYVNFIYIIMKVNSKKHYSSKIQKKINLEIILNISTHT